MDAVIDRRRERRTAFAILAVAVLIAAWILHRPKPDTLPVPRIPEPATSDFSETLMAPVEVVELPASMMAPAPARAPAAPPAPQPPPQQAAAVQPPPPAPPQPVPEPQRVEVPPPEPAITVLKPTPVAPVPPPQTVEPISPELVRQVEAPEIKPLTPTPVIAKPPPKLLAREDEKQEPALPMPLKPIQPDADELAAFRTAREEAKAIEPLKPGPLPKPMPTEKVDLAAFRAAREDAKAIEPLKPEPLPKPMERARAEPPPQPSDIPPLPPAPPQREPVKAAPPPPPLKRYVEAPRPAMPPAAPPQPRPAPQPTITSGNVGEGRALLRILEQGSGPGIQIGWPGDGGARDRLYSTLVQCFGMRVGVMDAQNQLFMAEGQPGEPSEFNTDRYSGFVRRPEGAMAADEQREVTRLRGYHHVSAPTSIRVFPRRVDAFLISGLRQAVGENYLSLKSIHAVYRVSGRRVTVDTIVADGKPVPGVIDLSAVSTSCSE